MVFVTTMLLIFLIALMNIWAIVVRNRLKRRFSTGQF
jgi:phosphate transport system permease protein